ncbi:hypothetical protein [Formosa sp. L2A11]|uniref:hypothetical protein n=1 Tax=Formosa sp. L2A11 TaxID=2686363 RepID=UPI00131ED123|nr:hypothetical protein [Formosa sp. L2A11]
MGLSISGGILADFIENEPEGYEAYKIIFENINKILVSNNFEPYQEPNVLKVKPLSVGSFPYSFLHHLRRFLAHVWENEGNENWTPIPFSPEENPTKDAILEDYYSYMSSHLLIHSDSEGFYIPVVLQEVLFDTDKTPVPGAMIGSSYILLEELKDLTKYLDIKLDANNTVTNIAEVDRTIEKQGDFWIEKLVCVTLIKAAKYSIDNKTAIVFN